MSDKTKIEWTNATWNPVRGCSLVSAGCTNCYAMRQAHRQKNGAYKGLTRLGPNGPLWTGDVRLVPEALDYPLRLKKPHMMFVNSMSDLFHESIPDEWLDKIHHVMWRASQHTFQVLTKRPDRMLDYMRNPNTPGGKPLPNVWLGVSVEDQKTADERIPLLLQTPAAVRWISAEPLLGPIDLPQAGLEIRMGDLDGPDEVNLDWVVVGGESGPKARPMHPDWARSLRDQCAAAGVKFFFKQWGEWTPYQENGAVNGFEGRNAMKWSHFPSPFYEDRDKPEGRPAEGVCVKRNAETTLVRNCQGAETYPEMVRVGKKAAGRLLNGREWNEFPATTEAR